MIRRRPIERRSRPRRRRKGKLPALSTLRNKLDAAFSAYVRDRDGAPCITCGAATTEQNRNAGHFIRRGYMATRWDPKNVHVQCMPCNNYRRGALDAYALAIVDEYGHDELRRLLALKAVKKQWKRWELESLLFSLRVGGAHFEARYYELMPPAEVVLSQADALLGER